MLGFPHAAPLTKYILNALFQVFDETFYYLLASAGNQFGTPVFFLADAPARYNAWDEFVFIVFIDFWLREVMNLVPLFLLLRIRRRRIMHGMNLFLIDL